VGNLPLRFGNRSPVGLRAEKYWCTG